MQTVSLTSYERRKEMEMNFASKGVAGTALGIGIGALGLNLLQNGLGGIFGGGTGCSDNMPVTRYELHQQTEIANRDMEIAYLKGRDAAKTDSLELYQYIDGRFRDVEAQIAQQAVVNAQISANLACQQTAIATLQGLAKTVIPITSVCPNPMPEYNSWTAPTATT
jgi:hypothetical protein